MDLKTRLEMSKQNFQESLQQLKQSRPQAQVKQILEETQHNLNLITANLVDRGVMKEFYQSPQPENENPVRRLREEIRQLELQLEKKKAELCIISQVKVKPPLSSPAALSWKRLAVGFVMSLFIIVVALLMQATNDPITY